MVRHNGAIRDIVLQGLLKQPQESEGASDANMRIA